MKEKDSLTIKQSNRVTNSLRDFTPYQEKFFMCIMAVLQEAINLSFNGGIYTQLSLFNDNDDYIKMEIPLKTICTPNNYDHARKQILAMVQQAVTVRYVNENNEGRIFSSSLFSVDVPEVAEWKSIVKIKMDKIVAKHLIEISKDIQGRPIQYTKYLLNTALKFKLQYSAKFYVLISSWETKGSFTYTKEELYAFLNVEKTTAYSIFKRDTLKKVHKEIKDKSIDLFFEFTEIKEGKNVVAVKFNIFNRVEQNHQLQLKVDSIKNMLTQHFNFTQKELLEIDHIFEVSRFSYVLIIQKLDHIASYLANPDNVIHNKVKYTIKALENVYD